VRRLSTKVLAGAVGGAIAVGFSAGLWVATSSGKTTTTIGPSYGVSLDLPNGWTGRVYNEQPTGTQPAANLQAGSFVLPRGDDDTGTKAAAAMRRQDFLIIMWEAFGRGGGFDYRPQSSAPQLTPEDSVSMLEGFPPTHALARLFFSTQGREFELIVEFGTPSADPGQLERANRVLETLRVEPAGPAASPTVRSGDVALLGKRFARTQDPPLTLTIPDGWTTNAAWMNQQTNPVPLVAVQNRNFRLLGEQDNPLIPNELELPPDVVVLTIMGVPLRAGERYLPATASASAFSAAVAPLSRTNVGGVSSLFAWVMRPEIGWGYLIYGWVGPDAGLDAGLMRPLINSIRFRPEG
jgi:hypothetical protein